MRLPGYGYSRIQPQSLGRHDVNQPLRVAGAQARSAAIIARAGVSLATVGVEAYQKKTAADLKWQTDEANIRMANTEFELNQQISRLVYKPGEIPEDTPGVETTDPATGQPKQYILASDAAPQIYLDGIRKSINQNALLIEDEKARALWVANAELQAADKFGKLSVVALKTEAAQRNAVREVQFAQSMKEGNYIKAMNLATTFESEAERLDKTEEVRQGQEISAIGIVLNGEDPKAMKKMAAEMNSEEYGGVLGTNLRHANARALRDRAYTLEARDNKSASAGMTIIRSDTTALIARMYQGEYIPAVHSAAALEATKNTFPELHEELKRAIAANKHTYQFRRDLTLGQRENVLKQEKERNLSAHDQKVHAIKQRQFEDDRRKASTDNLALGRDTGILELAPLNMQNFSAWLQNRANGVVVAQSQFGTFTGFFTGEEKEQFKDWFGRAGLSDKLAIATSAQGVLGKNAPAFFEQFKAGSGLRAFGIAGQTSLRGDLAGAKNILRGEQIFKDSPELIPNKKQRFTKELGKRLGNAYMFNEQQRASVSQAAKQAYATIAADNGAYPGGENYQESVEDKWMDEAIMNATGGILKFQNSRVEAPTPGMTDRDFENWITNLPSEYMTGLGASNVSGADLHEQLKDGDVALAEVSRGQYALYQVVGGKFVLDQDGKAVMISYDMQVHEATQKEEFAKGKRFRARWAAGQMKVRKTNRMLQGASSLPSPTGRPTILQ